jgi:integrase
MWQRNYVSLPSGERVRYTVYERGDGYHVRFTGRDGGRVRRSTGELKKAQAVEAAHRIILEEYGQVPMPAAKRAAGSSWEEAEERLKDEMEADGKRPKTIKGYLETLAKLKAVFPSARGPADVTDAEAAQFKTKYAVGSSARGKHKPKSLDSRLRTLKAIFTWFKRLKLVEKNAFDEVPQPELDRHEVRYVKVEDLEHFYTWLADRYHGWSMPLLFFQVKALTGCRLDDLCNIRSEQLQDGRIVFSADQTKNRAERYATLPVDVFKALDGYKGKTFLWEPYPAELIDANKANDWPVHRQSLEFSPRRLYNWIQATMQTYQKETGRDLSSHDFRRAAFTRAAEADIHPKRAATAFDVTADTMMRYYTGTEKKKTADDVLGGLAEKLRLKKQGEERER